MMTDLGPAAPAIADDLSGGETSADRPTATPHVVHEMEDYSATVQHGATVEAIELGRGVRMGAGSGPNVILPAPGPRLSVLSSRIGFPMGTAARVVDGHVGVMFAFESKGDSRWAGFPVRAGSLLVYGPDASHLGVNRPGLSFAIAGMPIEALAEAADRLCVELHAPPTGTVAECSNMPSAAAVGDSIDRYLAAARQGQDLGRVGDDVIDAIVGVLGAGHRDRTAGDWRGIDSRQIVGACLDYVDATRRVPSISELCVTAHVSERRLRDAFVSEFDEPPSRYFRAWALDEARRRLLAAESDECNVTDVAVDLGCDHLGRFAAYYKQIYEESPSATLRAPAAAR